MPVTGYCRSEMLHAANCCWCGVCKLHCARMRETKTFFEKQIKWIINRSRLQYILIRNADLSDVCGVPYECIELATRPTLIYVNYASFFFFIITVFSSSFNSTTKGKYTHRMEWIMWIPLTRKMRSVVFIVVFYELLNSCVCVLTAGVQATSTIKEEVKNKNKN